MRPLWFWIPLLLGSAVSSAFLWLTEIPLGIPGEWTWGRHDVTPDLTANLLLGLAAGTMYLIVVMIGRSRLARANCTNAEATAWLVALAIAAGGWLWMVQGTGSSGATIGRWPFVLYYPSSSGYFFRARYESPDAREFLHNYEALMREGDVLHTGTHPPGLFLFFHGLIGVTKAVPAVIPMVNASQPDCVREAFDVVQTNSLEALRTRQQQFGQLTSVDRAVIWLGGLICFTLAVITVWPLYGFLRQDLDRATSWLAAAAWPLIPAIAIFLPKSDVAYACLAMSSAWSWRMAWKDGSFGWAALAGGLWALGLICSLAFLPVALWLAIWSLVSAWQPLRTGHASVELLRLVKTIIPAAMVAIGVLMIFSKWGDVNLFQVFWLNYRNHAGFYAQFSRSYLGWLAVNPIELTLSLGVPMFLAGVGSCGISWSAPSDSAEAKLRPACVATLVVWGWLWLSGKNSGEAARLWIFLMPFAATCCAVWWSKVSADNPRGSHRLIWAWLVCQVAVCLLTVQRVNGFPIN